MNTVVQSLLCFDGLERGQPVLADCHGVTRRGVYLSEQGDWARVMVDGAVVGYRLAELTALALPFAPVDFDTFYLGTHEASWLWGDDVPEDVPLFVAIQRLRRYKKWKAARRRFSLDSGGFTELQKYGRWTISPRQYVDELYRVQDEIGGFEWASSQDWMCEPIVIQGGQAGPVAFAGTGLSVERHQELTIDNFLTLKELAPDLPIMPVLQGYKLHEYLRHIEDWERRGVQLAKQPVVGVGSVCRRESTAEVASIFRAVSEAGISPHGFGVKGSGLALYARYLKSADSLAWSYAARRDKPLPGCSHGNCNSCPRYALMWREKVLRQL